MTANEFLFLIWGATAAYVSMIIVMWPACGYFARRDARLRRERGARGG
ncbi:MAG: hypothetical protein LCH38_10980 [Proteobacteria bacterium]|nr:hypothetical protein [Pseudomonadota bacterium]